MEKWRNEMLPWVRPRSRVRSKKHQYASQHDGFGGELEKDSSTSILFSVIFTLFLRDYYTRDY